MSLCFNDILCKRDKEMYSIQQEFLVVGTLNINLSRLGRSEGSYRSNVIVRVTTCIGP